jgi:hypothetical protein
MKDKKSRDFSKFRPILMKKKPMKRPIQVLNLFSDYS